MDTTIDAKVLTWQQQTHLWKHIVWANVIKSVRRLQVRIAKAWKEGSGRKIKNLQKLLINSFYAKLLAVKRVTSSKGSKTPGVDEIVWKSPAIKMDEAIRLGKENYTPSPLKRTHIPKKNGKTRALGIPTMKDRAMQALHLLALEPISESSADKNSYGFRPCRSAADAIEQCFSALSRKGSAQYVLEADIKACFDEISHEWMLEHIPMDKIILRKMLKAGVMERRRFYPTELGTPQGGIISPTLANMTLDGIEKYLSDKLGSYAIHHKIHFIRYADDFIVTADSEDLLKNEIKPLLATFLKQRGLRLSEEKTTITHIQEGFTFLGQTIRKFKDKLIIKPSKKSIKALLDKIREVCKKHKQVKVVDLIAMLNPIIRGWANYHRHVVSSVVFQRVDCEIFQIIWKWAERRHPKKGRKWVKDKYFLSHLSKNWVFSSKSKDGSTIRLFHAFQVKIWRHIKVKQVANPFDPNQEKYFEMRKQRKMLATVKGKKQSRYLRSYQNNLCAFCQKELPDDGGEYHFKRSWVYGGSSQTSNLVIVHPECHERLHAKNCNTGPGH